MLRPGIRKVETQRAEPVKDRMTLKPYWHYEDEILTLFSSGCVLAKAYVTESIKKAYAVGPGRGAAHQTLHLGQSRLVIFKRRTL